MVRETFEQDLQVIQDDVLVLGSMVEEALTEAVAALKQRDEAGSRAVIGRDRVINERRFEIEDSALVLIATQQPMARDLRILAAVLEIVTELERIGDYAKGIGRINLMMGDGKVVKPLIDIPRMAEKARSMLHRALEAFAAGDVALARAIPQEDDEVDALYNQVYRELMTRVVADATLIEQANYLLWVAHNLERAADRVTNICERVIFMVTGRMAELDVDSGESAVH
jgi:phosphate transport system protein